jgi:hypothetical protein
MPQRGTEPPPWDGCRDQFGSAGTLDTVPVEATRAPSTSFIRLVHGKRATVPIAGGPEADFITIPWGRQIQIWVKSPRVLPTCTTTCDYHPMKFRYFLARTFAILLVGSLACSPFAVSAAGATANR